MDSRKINPTDTSNSTMQRELGLYIHIPFCIKKCDYCDFLSAPAGDAVKKEYFDALITEIRSYQGIRKEYNVPTIFFGGGTPSCAAESDIQKVMETINQVFCIDQERLEATIEVNPGTVTADKLKAYRRAGINRLSFGLQSANNQELQLLGRIHSYKEFLENYFLAREMGFQNINIDLMSALPGQTLSSWENTLQTVAMLNPEHISAYSLIIEEGTKFYDRYREGAPCEKELPEEEVDRQIYYRTKELLEQFGYHRYEISNYAKEGYECRHNRSYWVGTEYLGIGLGAASLLKGRRFSNIRDMGRYLQLMNKFKDMNEIKDISDTKDNPLKIRENIEQLTQQQRMEEFMFLGLRLCAGVSREDFLQRFGIEMDCIYGKLLAELKEKKLLDMQEDRIWLTDYGIDISNSVLSNFLLD